MKGGVAIGKQAGAGERVLWVEKLTLEGDQSSLVRENKREKRRGLWGGKTNRARPGRSFYRPSTLTLLLRQSPAGANSWASPGLCPASPLPDLQIPRSIAYPDPNRPLAPFRHRSNQSPWRTGRPRSMSPALLAPDQPLPASRLPAAPPPLRHPRLPIAPRVFRPSLS